MQSNDPTLGADSLEPSPSLEDLGPGSLVGRYAVLEELGRGGMGVVFAAYDPQLDRKVALKLLRGAAGEMATARLLREAQALARVTHPNVCTVHDVGTFGESVFVAMEYLDGETLAAWQRGKTWPEILAVYRQAAEGLMAAHDAALVHRDFKPDNVIVGADGRVRVLDFGLAREGAAEATPGEEKDDQPIPSGGSVALSDTIDVHSSASRPVSVSAKLTQVGAIVGTPAYMSPEQFRAADLDPRADQFSFCVALFEALYGVNPFEGNSPAERYMNIEANEVVTPPDPKAVPSFVHGPVVRGLSAAPEARFPSMRALMAALARDPRARRRRLASAAVLVTVVGAGLGAAVLTREDPQAVCAATRADADAVVTPRRVSSVRAALLKTGLPYAADTHERVMERLGMYLEQWRDAREQACRATRIDGAPQLEEQARVACLERRLAEVDMYLTALESPTEASVEKAIEAAHKLPSVDSCADAATRELAVAPPETVSVRKAVTEIQRALDEVQVYERVGRADEQLPRLAGLLERASSLGYPPIEAEVELEYGLTLRSAGKSEKAVEHLERAVTLGMQTGDVGVVERAASQLATVSAVQVADPSAAELWLKVAGAHVRRAGDPPSAQHRWLDAAGVVDFSARRFKESAEHHRAAVQLARTAKLGSSNLASSLGLLANALTEASQYEEAIRIYREALQMRLDMQGPDHPATARVHNNLGIAYERVEQMKEATEHYERSLHIKRKVLGRRHPSVGSSLGNLGNLALKAQDGAAARRYFTEALKVFEGQLKPDHPFIVLCHVGLANAALLEDELQRALEIGTWVEAHTEADSRQRAHADWIRARGLLNADPGQARGLARRAREVFSRDEGDQSMVEEIDAFLLGAQGQ